MASTQRVFAVSELLESVLQYIPERDLLLFQRVNQTFRNVIKHSPQLQRKLFYTADVYQEGDLLRKLKWNPLLNIFHSYKISNYSIERSAACGTWERWRELNQSNQLSLEDFVRSPKPAPIIHPNNM